MSVEITELIARLRDVAYDIETGDVGGDEAASAIREVILELKRIHGIDERYGDPFEIIGNIPEDRAYQWVTLTVAGMDAEALRIGLEWFLDKGWAFVPPERHPEMPADNGKIIVFGQVLLEHSKEHGEGARREELEKPEMMVDHWVTLVQKMEMPKGFTPVSGYVSYSGGFRRIEERKSKDVDE